ncbi:MAG: hypothetical protein KDE55_06150 [Novosphingobium sp.]|nr:hypothetical protein [Novosphingobium sp.]
MSDLEQVRQNSAKRRREASEAGVRFLLEGGLYDQLKKDECPQDTFTRIENARLGTFDCFCIKCKRETPFICHQNEMENRGGGLQEGNELYAPPSVFALRSVCQRCLTVYFYVFRKEGDIMTKIGQLPSIADIAFSELRDIDAGLAEGDRKELGKAIGLYAHGAALGGFAYLRRVFERMIDRGHERMAARGEEVEGFAEMRMAKRIASVADELPDAVVSQKGVFAVLSLGLHELDEEKCKELFPLMKAVIFQMLEKEEHLRKKARSERETAAALTKVMSSDLQKAVETKMSDGK